MKKALSIFFLVYYLIFSFGFVVNKHFCRGELVSLEIMLPAESCCDDTEEDENSCCSSDQDIIFLDDQQVGMQSISIVQPIMKTSDMLTDVVSPSVNKKQENGLVYRDKPPPKKISSYLLNCSFTFYG